MNVELHSEADPLDAVVESFLRRYRDGERPSLVEYTDRHPELADRIREVFPALVMIEEIGSVGGVLAPPAPDRPGTMPDRLGDYRLLREIGRGGMGIVYEAVQESLGRHVALKVLPAATAGRELFLERFRREAQALARLHHTNIVPVFGVGESNDIHYYAMQFIQGQGLDAVLADVKRLRGLAADWASAATVSVSADAGEAARSLLAGHFPTAVQVSTEKHTRTTPLCPPTIAGDDSALSAQSEAHYYQSIARLGVQAAEGLAHAHAQGVLHRDIKPSNLLLDALGVLWITDFGLAKTEDSDNMTHTGDLVGTFRYMAPERFEGRADGRTDIYALGVTLYEMLTLRPPFDAADRVALIGQITHDAPPPPRTLAPLLPRDLETIVLKSMARDPADRYATGVQLADDLRCFLENRPITARRSSAGERLRRWCRRNPAIASLTAALFLLLVCLTVGSSLAAVSLKHQRDEAVREEEEKTGKLFDSLVHQANASRLSRQAGQRFKTLEIIREAVGIARERNMPSERLAELRISTIACLALPDWRQLREWEGLPPGSFHVTCDDRYRHYARTDVHGHISLCRVRDGAEVAQFDGFPGEAWLSFSPGGRYLMAEDGRKFRIWDLASPQPSLVRQISAVQVCYSTFHPDGRHWVIWQKGEFFVHDLSSNAAAQSVLKLPFLPTHFALHPSGHRLAITTANAVNIYELKTRKLLVSWPLQSQPYRLVWDPRGGRLATICADRRIYVWDANRRRQTVVMKGCTNGGTELAFTPDGELLASCGWEGKIRFWDPSIGKQVLNQGGYGAFGFGPEGSLFLGRGSRLLLSEVVVSREYRTFVRQSASSEGIDYLVGAIHPQGRLLAVTTSRGMVLWDLSSEKECAFIPLQVTSVLFEPSGGAMVTNGLSGLNRWPVRIEGTAGTAVTIGPPQHLYRGTNARIACSENGKVLAQGGWKGGALLFRRDRSVQPIHLQPQFDVRHVAVSKGGGYAATGSHGGEEGIKIWETKEGHFLKRIPASGLTRPLFSPDGQWLAVQGSSSGCLLKVGTWEQGALIAPRGYTAFSPNGSLLAVGTQQGVTHLSIRRPAASLHGWRIPTRTSPSGSASPRTAPVWLRLVTRAERSTFGICV